MHWITAATSSWELGWDSLVAVGTLALAFATFALASRTRGLASATVEEVMHSKEQVVATQRQADAAQEALEAARAQTRLAQLTLNAQIRPVLIQAPRGEGRPEPIAYSDRSEPVHHPQGTPHVVAAEAEVLISVPLRNAGAGLAMIRGVDLTLCSGMPGIPTRIEPPNVPPHECGRVNFRATPADAAFSSISESVQQHRDFSVNVAYSDLTGEQQTITRFDVYTTAARGWVVRQIHLTESGADEPFVGSAPIE
jgi:hypothetical protein